MAICSIEKKREREEKKTKTFFSIVTYNIDLIDKMVTAHFILYKCVFSPFFCLTFFLHSYIHTKCIYVLFSRQALLPYFIMLFYKLIWMNELKIKQKKVNREIIKRREKNNKHLIKRWSCIVANTHTHNRGGGWKRKRT